MAATGADRLYSLLPAVYREQDAEHGFPLRGLTRLLGSQLDLLERDVAPALERPLRRDLQSRG